MKEIHKSFIDKFIILQNIYKEYEFDSSITDLTAIIDEIKNFKVTVPLVGAFSTGKSSLINELIATEILSTGITPETAIPAELSYGPNKVTILTVNGEKHTEDIEKLMDINQSRDVSLLQISLENDILSKISNVKIVDMPGFDSGIEIHNKAISDYLPNSLAYIITVSAEDGTLKDSILNFLSELKLNNMPVYIVITKADKTTIDEANKTADNVKKIIEKRMNLNDIKVAITSADDGNTEGFLNILLDIQNKSDEIFTTFYSNKLKYYANNMKKYLEKQISLPNKDILQINEEKKVLESQIEEIKLNLKNENDYFLTITSRVVDEIYSKVESDLNASRNMLEGIVIQGRDISDKINSIVRNAITAGLREKLEPVLRKYIDNISELSKINIESDCSGYNLIDKRFVEDNENMRQVLNSAISPVTTIVATVIGTIIGGPFGSVIGATVGAILGAILGRNINQYARELEENQKREEACLKVGQVINEVLTAVKPKIESAVDEMRNNVYSDIKKKFNINIEIEEKKLKDLEANMMISEQEQKQKIDGYKSNLNTIVNMFN